MFRIGAFARIGGVSAKQLRAYDELGIFAPVWVDPANGYRYYSPAQLPELRRVLALRDLGLPLGEIRQIVAGGDLRRALARRHAELERERRQVEERLAALEISIAGEQEPDVVLRPVAAEAVAVLHVNAAVADAFSALETHVRDVGRRAHRPPGAIPAEALIYVPVTGPIPATERISNLWLPAVRGASLIHRGPYSGIADARATLQRWVMSAGLDPAGPMRTVYLQFGAEPELRVPAGYVVTRAAEFVTELVLPVA